MLSSRIRSQPASSSARSWSRSVTSTSTGEAGVRRADRVEGGHDATGGDHVVVLDHRHVAEAEPVVDPAAAAHGVLLQRPPAGQRLAGVEDARRRALQRGHPGGGGGGDAGEVRGEVERGALGGQQAAGRSGDAHHHVAGGDPAAVGEPVGDLDAPAHHLLEDQRGDPETGHHAGLAGPEHGRAAGATGDGRGTGDVDAVTGEVLLQGSRRSRPGPRPGRGRPATSSSRTPLMRRRRRRAAPGGTPSRWSRR